ncbi:hypothetical protein GCM10022233_56100 [Streptomyces shaanxiensis]|uniref:Cytokinin dehydrogenase 1 FAD/cytokinin binding domain-containing protein n=1 Tax=Streptomyces shaanxiensis TaxID=653357 RepID=A0ABP7VPT0_9ACTN
MSQEWAYDQRPASFRAAAADGTHYPVGSIPFTRADWRTHFGSAWPRLELAKRTYDPRGILVPARESSDPARVTTTSAG